MIKKNKLKVYIFSLLILIAFSIGYSIGKVNDIEIEKDKTGYQLLQEGYIRLNNIDK